MQLLYAHFPLSTPFSGVTFILPMLFRIQRLLASAVVSHHHHECFAGRAWCLGWRFLCPLPGGLRCWCWWLLPPHSSVRLGLLLHVPYPAFNLVYTFQSANPHYKQIYHIQSVEHVGYCSLWSLLHQHLALPSSQVCIPLTDHWWFFYSPEAFEDPLSYCLMLLPPLRYILCPHYWGLCYHVVPVFLYNTPLL